jgi:hypothetical protein
MPYRTKSSAIIHELLDDEIIIANLETGIYYSIRESGIPIWQLLLSGHDLDAIAHLFREKYSKDLFSPIESFVEELVKEELLIVSESATENPSSEIFWPKDFSFPTLERYHEMKNLLMLDPIHEVDEQGWPHRSLK